MISIWQGKHHTEETRNKIKEIIHSKYDEIFGENHPNYGKHWINNGINNMLVSEEDLLNYTDWNEGRINCKRTITEKVLKSCENRCYINKNGVDKLLKKDKAKILVENDGWSYGRCRKKKIWVNKEGKSYMIDYDKTDDYIKMGFNLGRI